MSVGARSAGRDQQRYDKARASLIGPTDRLMSARSDLPEPNTNSENNSSSDNDLDNGVAKSATHEAVTDECDCDQFDDHHPIGELQRDAQV